MSTASCRPSVFSRTPRRARGAVLVTGLIILAVMTVLGVSSMRGTVLEERMAGNLKDQTNAFQAGEAGIQAALTAIERKPLPPATNAWGSGTLGEACKVIDPNTADSCTVLDTVLANWRGSAAPTSGVALASYGGAPLGGLTSAQQPRIVVESRYYPVSLESECLDRRCGIHFYTVSALGIGPSGKSETILQSTIAKVYGW